MSYCLRTCIIEQPSLAQAWQGKNVFAELQQLPGTVYRQVARRKTFRFEHDGEAYFAKLHWGVGWKEILKNLFQGRLPILGAKNEWRAIKRLEELQVPTLKIAAYGQYHCNPAQQQSFIVTHALNDTISLEELCQTWRETPPNPTFKRSLIKRVAQIARQLHQNGVNHRDFYLCHFLLSNRAVVEQDHTAPLYVIDLHRAQCRQRVPKRWLLKDISGLYFSALDCGLTQRDLYRFMHYYTQQPLRLCLSTDIDFWRCVRKKALALYKKEFQQ